MFLHEDGQLRTAHLILGYKPISISFQAPKCVIKAKDPRQHCISIAVLGFLLPKGILILEGALVTQPILEGNPKVAPSSQHPTSEATSSQPTNKEGDEEVEEKEKEIADISDSNNLYKEFNQPSSPVTSTGVLGQSSPPQSSSFEGVGPLSDEMGIQRKQSSTLQ